MEGEQTNIEISDVAVKKKSKFLLFVKSVFHFGVFLHFMVVLYYGISIFFSITEKQMKEPLIRMAKVYFWAFLTIWNVTFQTTFLCLALSYDVLQWIDKHGSTFGKQIRYMREIVFNGLVAPFTCFVSAMFWAVYAIDRELVFPEVYDDILPWWLNHCVHTNIIIVVAIETILQSRRHPTDVKVEAGCYIFISVFYAIVYYSIFFFAHVWLYGVFGVMTWWQVCLYQLLIWASAYVFYHMIFIINRMIHGPESLEEICPKELDGEKAQNLKRLGSNGRSQIIKVNEVAKEDKNEDEVRNNGSEVKNEEVSRMNGSGIKSTGDFVKVTKNNESSDVTNGDMDGITNKSYNGGEDNEKVWKSIETNGVSETDGSGNDFGKSWSAKYRTSRSQFENSSL